MPEQGSFKVYVFKRILMLIPVIILVTFVTFTLAYVAPGDPIFSIFTQSPAEMYTQEQYEALRHSLGLDQPFHVIYLRWLWMLLHGNLGSSYIYGEPVSKLIGRAVLNTLKLQIVSLILAIAIAVPAGVISAVKQYSKTDKLVSGGALFLWSIPWFWYGLIMILVFSVYLKWFPTHGMGGGTLVDQVMHMVLPVTVLATASTGLMLRITRSSMLEVLRQDYILVARSKGLSERIIIYKHALRNALLPLVTVIGLYFGFIFSGSLTTEIVFAWPGCGWLIMRAALNLDYPLVMGIMLIVSLSVSICILITDVIYAFLDPRIRHR